ncbi:hypothetical protein Mapa_003270 [Marchantia paleacea]|nr:hypothetical protein Mapa_003270 [Marchantia paleacea]
MEFFQVRKRSFLKGSAQNCHAAIAYPEVDGRLLQSECARQSDKLLQISFQNRATELCNGGYIRRFMSSVRNCSLKSQSKSIVPKPGSLLQCSQNSG